MATVALAPPGIGAEELTQEFLRCRRQLQAVIFRVVRSWDESQALTQDCFLRAYRARHTFNGQASAATWLTRIAINLSYEWLRRVRHNFFSAEQPSIAAELRTVAHHTATPEQELLARSRSEFIAKLLHRLPPHQRELMQMRYLNEMSMEEIVVHTGLSMTTVKARLNRARAALRKRAAHLDLPAFTSPLPNSTSTLAQC
ncbi:MAG: sigma-70 family RNA polymerase sigma factor [Candidatus Koribacter versatilis]|uniref:Sigma-70 family RNA polymerase sigma factor n=1 Tax=Candidatus Korobacter versatilis TaxID=658062 RepID=A0A932A8W3_9BACT|nr:sigma-70 family RNA polymerase sigma factor [Candidatus Koribacter versatilis]